MSLVPAKCPECGGNINIDSEKKAAICEFCKAPFVVEDAINNFNTTYNITNNNDIKADVVNVYESEDKEFVIRAGELIEYKGESTDVIVPESVKSIGARAFFKNRIETIRIPKNVKLIGSYAFEECSDLKSVVIEAEIIETGDDIFKCCNSIETIIHNKYELKNTVSWKYYRESNYKNAEFCFTMKSFVSQNGFPVGIEKIVANSNNECIYPNTPSSFSSIIIPKSVYEISDGAFYGYSNLEDISLPMGIKTIGSFAFARCDSLKAIKIPGSVKRISSSAFISCKSLEIVIIEEGVEVIDEYAFSGCISLKRVVLPNSIKVIGKCAFSGDNYFYDPGYLKELTIVDGSEVLIRQNISKFDINSPFVRNMALKYCPYCGGEYKGLFNKKCVKCGRDKF